MRQNELRDSIANLLSDVAHGVDIEPLFLPSQGASIALQSTTTDDDDARLDIMANDFGNRGSTTLILMFKILTGKKLP